MLNFPTKYISIHKVIREATFYVIKDDVILHFISIFKGHDIPQRGDRVQQKTELQAVPGDLTDKADESPSMMQEELLAGEK